jgi:hypothetical protein
MKAKTGSPIVHDTQATIRDLKYQRTIRNERRAERAVRRRSEKGLTADRTFEHTFRNGKASTPT